MLRNYKRENLLHRSSICEQTPFWHIEISSRVRVYLLRVAVAEARGQFRNPEKGGHPLLEAGTRGLMKTQLSED
jgi:hypothetical protein